MAEVDSSFVKRGFWINYSQGQVLGATLTTDQQVANLIIALLAVVVSVAAGSTWNLLLFAHYQSRATSEPRDGLYRQQQALYRALATPGSVLVDSLKFLEAWHRRTTRPILFRCLVPAFIAGTFALASLAAGVFSSYIVTTTDLEVLVAGEGCRFVNWTAYLDTGLQVDTLESALYTSARSFAEQCYGTGPLPSQCNVYINPRIEPTLSFVNCPFGPDVCMNGTKAAMLDSVYMDSNDIFGINAPAKDRVLLRRRATCAPLDTPKFTTFTNSSDPDIAPLIADRYGPSLENINDWWLYSFGALSGYPGNITFLHSTLASNVSEEYELTAVTDFYSPDLKSPKKQTFAPIDGLAQDNADVTLIFFFGNSILSFEPIDDPIYSAHVEIYKEQLKANTYLSDHSAGALGCMQEYEFCIRIDAPDLECSPTMGETPNFDNMQDVLPSANDMQRATLDLLGSGTALSGLSIAAGTTPPYLNITSRLWGEYLQGAPPDQWVLDFQHLESFVWAYARIGILNFFTGFAGLDSEGITYPADTAARKNVCRNQKVVKAGGFANIGVFGLSFTLSIATTLLLLDFAFLRLYVLHGTLRKRPGIRAWIDDGMYELQRRAYELYEGVEWQRTDQELPVTGRRMLLRGLDGYPVAAAKMMSVSSTALLMGGVGSGVVSQRSSASQAGSGPTPATTDQGQRSNTSIQPQATRQEAAAAAPAPPDGSQRRS